jgi:hypothetical protein
MAVRWAMPAMLARILTLEAYTNGFGSSLRQSVNAQAAPRVSLTRRWAPRGNHLVVSSPNPRSTRFNPLHPDVGAWM